ncbi:MAG: PadR family transcriptional regulator [Candidatus Bathyarchaeia archaeon]
MAIVPKGFLRFQVLELLNEKPLSGSEIINEIEKRTNGCWKPSPGSVYPLLAWLQDNGCIKEVPAEESGIKRYALTDKGRQLFEEQRRARAHLHRGWKFLAPPLLDPFWPYSPSKEAGELREAFRRLHRAFFGFCMGLEEKFSEQAVEEGLRILNEAARKLEEVNRKLRSGDA